MRSFVLRFFVVITSFISLHAGETPNIWEYTVQAVDSSKNCFTLNDGLQYEFAWMANPFTDIPLIPAESKMIFTPNYRGTLHLDAPWWGSVVVKGHDEQIGQKSFVTAIDLEQGIIHFRAHDNEIHRFLVLDTEQDQEWMKAWTIGDHLVMGLFEFHGISGYPSFLPACGRYPEVSYYSRGRAPAQGVIYRYNSLFNVTLNSLLDDFSPSGKSGSVLRGCID